jgi:hypothetical protein
MSIVTVGIDLAKNVFAIHGVNETGKAILVKPKVTRERWPRLTGQGAGIFKWNHRGVHAADLIAGSVAKYASSGVRSSRLECGRLWLYRLM